MPTKGEEIPPPPRKEPSEKPLKPGMTYTQHWTRGEQIENAKEDGTLDEIKPPLTPEEEAAL